MNKSDIIKNRAQSFNSFSLLQEESLSISPSCSVYSLEHNQPSNTNSCYTDYSTVVRSSKRFHSTNLGKPPGSKQYQQQNKPPILSPSSSLTNHNKVAPMKEVEKMITDLKKENFDLKLRLYHLEDMVNKDLDLYQLNEENCRLRTNLNVRNKHLNELTSILLKYDGCSIGIQTEDNNISPTTTINSFHTAFATSPEAFGLSYNKVIHSSGGGDEDHLSSVVTALEKVKIIDNSSSSSSSSNIVDTWLDQNISNHQQGNLIIHP